MNRHFAYPFAVTSTLALVACVTNPSLGLGGDQDAGGASNGDASNVIAPADGGSSQGNVPDTGSSQQQSCATLLASMLSAPLSPPAGYAGLNLASGSNPNGLTIEEANAAGCATMLSDVPPATDGGYRTATFGTTDDVTVTYNLDSHVIRQVILGKNYKGSVKFHSRAGGAFGTHSYEIGIGRLLRDGQEMPLDWQTKPFPWASELFDGLLATFSPSTAHAPAEGCKADGECLVYDDGQNPSVFGMRDLAFYVMFAPGTNKPTGFYNFWKGGKADCSTPNAALEAMDWAPISPGFVIDANTTYGASIGGLDLTKPSPNGLTWQDADVIECHGKPAAAPDSGYGAIAWGPSGELLLEYNKTSNVAYKLIAKAGYKGTLDGQVFDANGAILGNYSIGIGAMTKNNAPFAIDWASPTATVTELANSLSGLTDTDCVAAGSCTITPDDGNGHAVLDFPYSLITVVLGKGTSAPQSISTTWDKGK